MWTGSTSGRDSLGSSSRPSSRPHQNNSTTNTGVTTRRDTPKKTNPLVPAKTYTFCGIFNPSRSYIGNMAPSLLRPQGHFSPEEVLQLAQQAPEILRGNPKAFSSSPLSFLFTPPETPELWTIYENLLLSCLRVGDEQAAHQCLERLVIRFGDDNERIMAFKGLVKEADAKGDAGLDAVLKEYQAILAEDATNIVRVPR